MLKHQQKWTLAVACWCLLCFFHQRQFAAPTPASRLALIMAFSLDGTFQIDRFEKMTPDKALINGHFYSDKAPGTVVLAALAAYPAVKLGTLLHLTATDTRLWLVASWVGCAALNAFLAVSFVCLIEILANFVPEKIAFLTALFLTFGTMAWPYSTMMFSHAQSIACITIGFWYLLRIRRDLVCAEEPMQKEMAREISFSGFFLGWALNSEYTTGLVVVALAIGMLGRNTRRWIYFSLGAFWPLLLIPIYSVFTVGNPLVLPYSYQASFPQMKQGLYAIGFPDFNTATKLLFSPSRGLFFWSPFLVLAVPGSIPLIHRNRTLFLLSYILPLVHIVVISGRVWDWPAGPSFSARYLAPTVPLLAIPCAIAFGKFKGIGYLLGCTSIILTAIATMTNATPDFTEYKSPLFSLQLPLFLHGEFNWNVCQVFGFGAYSGPILFVAAFVLFLIYGLCLYGRSQLPVTNERAATI